MSIGKFYTKISEELSFVHKTRRDSLLTISKALIDGSKLSVAQLGNRIINNTTPKHNIKKVDRLLGNKNLEVKEIYSKLSKMLLNNSMKEVILLVDWCIYENKKYHVLQASLVAEGRSLPIYRDAYDITASDFHQTTAENQFLDNLEKCIPSNICKVVIVTDAGFHTPWFFKVTKLGWDFVGRLRGNLEIKLDNDSWKPANKFFKKANSKPKFLGEAKVGKSVFNKYGIKAGVHIYHSPRKNRESVNKRYNKAINALYKSGNKEPWVILTSLRELDRVPQSVIKIYQKRMQIEQNFRDDKNNRWGFGFRSTKCSKAHRLSVYLLLAAIAQIFLWLIGFAAEKSGLKKMFQVNTMERRVLSYISLGKLIVIQGMKIEPDFVIEGLSHIASINSEAFP